MAGKKSTSPKAAPVAKEVKTPKKAATSKVVDGEPKKRNMSAVSNDFVNSVHGALSEDLKSKLKVKEVKELCEAFVKVLVENVKEGKTVNFTNNMSFVRKLRAARSYKNLKTQEKIEKPSHFVLTMTVKPNLKKTFDLIPIA